MPQVAWQHAERREGEVPYQEGNLFGDRNRRTPMANFSNLLGALDKVLPISSYVVLGA